jgi:hypothetical protein
MGNTDLALASQRSCEEFDTDAVLCREEKVIGGKRKEDCCRTQPASLDPSLGQGHVLKPHRCAPPPTAPLCPN